MVNELLYLNFGFGGGFELLLFVVFRHSSFDVYVFEELLHLLKNFIRILCFFLVEIMF